MRSLVVFLAALSLGSCAVTVKYKILSTLYLPYTYDPAEEYSLGEDAAEQMAFDKDNQILYSVGNTNIHVIDMSDVTSPQILYKESYPDCDVTDVEVCGDFVFIAFNNETEREKGFLNVYRIYNKDTGALELVNSVIVGTVPDMVKPTADCKTVLVAVEGELYDGNNTVVDRPGGVGVVTFDTDPSGNLNYMMADFTAFDNQYDTLKQDGVRMVYPGTAANPNVLSNALEPEYIEFNKDQTKAYITLQENNAIAVFDMATNTITDIYGLGYKDWSQFTMDASDKDDMINMQSYPVKAFYQPDAIKYITHNGVNYIVTANEGDSKDLDFFSEEERVKDFTLSSAFGSSSDIKDLQEDSALGRLKVTTLDGTSDGGETYDELYTFGGRSFSIRRANNMKLVYDSGDELERKMSELLPDNMFNANADPEETVSATFDKRSDDKGLEPESLATATVGNFTLIFVGSERPGAIAVYSINNNKAKLNPVFETLITDFRTTSGSWQEIYDNRQASMIDPEDLLFVPAADSPNGKNLLLVSGSVSGTVSVVQLNIREGEDLDGMGTKSASSISLLVTTLVITFIAKIY